jgi:hypothetical protein
MRLGERAWLHCKRRRQPTPHRQPMVVPVLLCFDHEHRERDTN